jgi:hypothetical protein
MVAAINLHVIASKPTQKKQRGSNRKKQSSFLVAKRGTPLLPFQ